MMTPPFQYASLVTSSSPSAAHDHVSLAIGFYISSPPIHYIPFVARSSTFLSHLITSGQVAICYHGGSWCLGASTDIQPQQVNYLLHQGIAVVSLEYRLGPQLRRYLPFVHLPYE